MGISKDKLHELFVSAGADDAGFVEIDREAFGPDADDMRRIFPDTRTVISIVKRVNRDSIRSPSVSIVDTEFASSHSALISIAASAIKKLNGLGIRGVATPPAFPMDMTRWPGKVWEVGHKTVAVEGGMGHMGVSRVVLHPEFGNHMVLGSMLIDAELDEYDHPLAESPCINCGLCVAVCPVGAITREEGLHFMSCAMHNYHELFGGFQDWIEGIVSAKNVKAYRSVFRDSETAAKWQSLTYGHFYRCSYCMAVCPAGRETVDTFRSDKRAYMEKYVAPLKNKKEPIYVIEGTRAEKAARRNDTKDIRYVHNTIRPASIETFLFGVPLLFNAEKTEGLDLTLSFDFTGKEVKQATIKIKNKNISVTPGLAEVPNLAVRADSETWVRMLNEEISPLRAIISGGLKVKGNPANLKKFKECIL